MATAPGPRGRVLFGRFSSFSRDSLTMLTELHREYGGVTRMRLGPFLVHQVTGPEAVKQVLQDNTDNYRRGRFYQRFRLFFGRGMLTSDGADWRIRRQVSQPFVQRGRVDAASPVITSCAEELLARWAGSAARGEPVDIVPDAMWLAMGVLGRMLFGTDLRERADELLPAVRFALKAMIITGEYEQLLPRWLPTRYQRDLRRHQATLNRVMDDVIDAHSAARTAPDDLVSALLAARDERTGQPWSRRAVRAELKTLFLAGHETTGCGLAWTLYALAMHPEVRRRLERELADVLGGRVPTVADLPNLPYLRQVVDESLRLYPPIWLFPRDAVADTEIGGYAVPGGSSVLIVPYAAHHSPEHWDNPEAFDPERFCPAGPGPARYTYLPFGGGPRRCIGAYLAQIEIQLTVAMVAQRYRLSLVPGHPVVPAPLVSLRPVNGVVVTLAPVGAARRSSERRQP